MDGCQYLPFRAQLRRDKNMGSAFVVVQFSQPLSMSTYQIRFSLLPLGFPNLDSYVNPFLMTILTYLLN